MHAWRTRTWPSSPGTFSISLKTVGKLVTFVVYPTNPSPPTRLNFPFHVVKFVLDDPLSSLHVARFQPWLFGFFRFCRFFLCVMHNVMECWCWHRTIWKRVGSNNENVAPIVRLSIIDVNALLSSGFICPMNHIVIFAYSHLCRGVEGHGRRRAWRSYGREEAWCLVLVVMAICIMNVEALDGK